MILADVAIIGAGMAGASLAALVARSASVMLIEAEAQPAYHATGRSAAFWSETYGGAGIQPLTTASHAFLATPPGSFSESGFLTTRGELHIADRAGAALLDGLATEFALTGVEMMWLDRAQLEARLPRLRAEWTRGLSEASCADIDVAALHAAWLRSGRRAGMTLLCDSRVTAIVRDGGNWRITAGGEEIRAGILVNAAGAWADVIARLAGVAPLDITPYRRTMAQIRVDPPAPADLPLVLDAAGTFYFKPASAGRLWLSPHDEIPDEPCDAAAEEIDVAIAIERLEQVFDWRVLAVERRWAGLRSFAPDRLPVYGFDPTSPGFFWFAGQGGFGIQTAPAAAMLAAALLTGNTPDDAVSRIDPAPYVPDRFLR